MNIAIIGAGNVGSALGGSMDGAGHHIRYGLRDPSAEKVQPLARDRASLHTIRDAVEGAEVVILAVPWKAAQSALDAVGDFGGRILVDATNPIGPGFSLTHGHTDSGGEQVARWAPTARVVKCFNSTGAENMASTAYDHDGLRPAMFLCGDDEDACAVVSRLAADIGFEPFVAGGLIRARLLEPLALVWINQAMMRREGRNIALAVMRRGAEAIRR